MAKRCEHCRFWLATLFKGESSSGWGVWWGDCAAGVDRGRDHHSLYLACDKFERHAEEEKPVAALAGVAP